jgi:hypothetical protein
VSSKFQYLLDIHGKYYFKSYLYKEKIMETIKVYDINELKEQFPDAFEKVLNRWQNNMDEVFWQDDIIASMKKTFEAANLMLGDWSLGAYSPCYVKFGMNYEEAEFEGKKAYNWLKDAFDLKSYRRVYYKNHLGKKAHRYDFTKTGSNKDWDWSCEFTGYCADYDYIESLFDDIHDGCNLKDAFSNLADVCGKLIEQEIEYQQSEGYFLERAESNDYKYTEDGIEI